MSISFKRRLLDLRTPPPWPAVLIMRSVDEVWIQIMEWALNLDTILLVAAKGLFCCACEGSNAMRVAVTLALFGPCLSYSKIDPVESVAIQCCWLYDHRASSCGTSER